MAELVRTLSESDRMLCPRSVNYPPDIAHALAVRFQDTVYEALKPFRNEETLELADDNASGQAVEAAMYGNRVTDRMWLMKDDVQIMYGGRFTTVETYWWQCCLCGLILPCTNVSHQ